MFHSKDFNASTGWSIVHHLFWVHTPSVCSSSIYLKASRMATSMRIGGSISSTWRRVRWILFVILSNVDTADSPKWSHIGASKIWWFPDLWGTHKSSPFMVFSIAKKPIHLGVPYGNPHIGLGRWVVDSSASPRSALCTALRGCLFDADCKVFCSICLHGMKIGIDRDL